MILIPLILFYRQIDLLYNNFAQIFISIANIMAASANSKQEKVGINAILLGPPGSGKGTQVATAIF